MNEPELDFIGEAHAHNSDPTMIEGELGEAHARRSDPSTSHAAAAATEGETANRLESKVVEALRAKPSGLTAQANRLEAQQTTAMTSFEDGPAKGQHLALKRAPRFLRVVREGAVWDALDQLTDQPKPNETLYAYEIVGQPFSVHINRAGGRGGFYMGGSYKLVEPQPSDAEMRLNWPTWCEWRAKHERH